MRLDGKSWMGRLIRLIAVLVLSLGLVSRIGCVKGSDPPRDIITNSIGMQFTYIPPGTFWMGRLRGRQGSQTELPRHFVKLTRGFYMGITEVTQGQWSRVMPTRPVTLGNVEVGSDYPVTYITWDAAVEFCKRLSEQDGRHYRLPTEAEWEYACRAGTRTAYSFGSDASVLGDYAWFYDNTREAGHEYAHLVAQKKPNPWGLYDVHGNVWEWCSDRYYDYSSGSVTDPTGGSSDHPHIMRGGSWFDYPEHCRSASRPKPSSDRGIGSNIGFRVVVDFE